jgi:hypothetical protein
MDSGRGSHNQRKVSKTRIRSGDGTVSDYGDGSKWKSIADEVYW